VHAPGELQERRRGVPLPPPPLMQVLAATRRDARRRFGF
jgi:hypothetical protein